MSINNLGVEIGFENSIYSVDEDAGSVTVCAAVPLVAGMERGRSLSVAFSTVSGSTYVLQLLISLVSIFLSQ